MLTEDQFNAKMSQWFMLYTKTAKTRNEELLYREMIQMIQNLRIEIEELKAAN